MLIDEYAEEELKKQVIKRYGKIKEVTLINFNPESLAT